MGTRQERAALGRVIALVNRQVAALDRAIADQTHTAEHYEAKRRNAERLGEMKKAAAFRKLGCAYRKLAEHSRRQRELVLLSQPRAPEGEASH